MNSMKPRPTEYLGIRFKSKTEAIFARCLDLKPRIWTYEPDWMRIDDRYVPDFVCPWIYNDHFQGLMVVELKPRGTTETYREEWRARTLDLRIKAGSIPTTFLLQEGWAFGEGEPISWRIKVDGSQTAGPTLNDLWAGPLLSLIAEAKQHRFDLKRSESE